MFFQIMAETTKEAAKAAEWGTVSVGSGKPSQIGTGDWIDALGINIIAHPLAISVLGFFSALIIYGLMKYFWGKALGTTSEMRSGYGEAEEIYFDMRMRIAKAEESSRLIEDQINVIEQQLVIMREKSNG